MTPRRRGSIKRLKSKKTEPLTSAATVLPSLGIFSGRQGRRPPRQARMPDDAILKRRFLKCAGAFRAERTPPACGFRRRAENIGPHFFLPADNLIAVAGVLARLTNKTRVPFFIPGLNLLVTMAKPETAMGARPSRAQFLRVLAENLVRRIVHCSAGMPARRTKSHAQLDGWNYLRSN